MGSAMSDEEDQYVREVQAAVMAIQELHQLTSELERSMAEESYEAVDYLNRTGQKRVKEAARRLQDLKTTTTTISISRRTAQVEKLESLFQKQQFEFELSCLKLRKVNRSSARMMLKQAERQGKGRVTSRLDDADAAIQAIEELVVGHRDAAAGNTGDSIHEEPLTSKSKKRVLEVDAMRRQVFYRRPPGFMESVDTTRLLLGSAGILFISYVVAKAAHA